MVCYVEWMLYAPPPLPLYIQRERESNRYTLSRIIWLNLKMCMRRKRRFYP